MVGVFLDERRIVSSVSRLSYDARSFFSSVFVGFIKPLLAFFSYEVTTDWKFYARKAGSLQAFTQRVSPIRFF